MQRINLRSFAEANPAKFEFELEKLCSSWLQRINRDAGIISTNRPSVFSIVDEAMMMLHVCGPKIYKKYAKGTYDLLTAQCCLSLRTKALPQYYRNSKGRICSRTEGAI